MNHSIELYSGGLRIAAAPGFRGTPATPERLIPRLSRLFRATARERLSLLRAEIREHLMDACELRRQRSSSTHGLKYSSILRMLVYFGRSSGTRPYVQTTLGLSHGMVVRLQ